MAFVDAGAAIAGAVGLADSAVAVGAGTALAGGAAGALGGAGLAALTGQNIGSGALSGGLMGALGGGLGYALAAPAADSAGLSGDIASQGELMGAPQANITQAQQQLAAQQAAAHPQIFGQTAGKFVEAHPWVVPAGIAGASMLANTKSSGPTNPNTIAANAEQPIAPIYPAPNIHGTFPQQDPYVPSYPSYAGGGSVAPAPGVNKYYAMGMQMAQPAQPAQQPPTTPNNPQQPIGMKSGGIADIPTTMMAGGGVPRMVSGPGDGVSDDVNAVIGGDQPAKIANGEFIIPSRIVSEIGNGSSDAGARRLYDMMDRVQERRKKTIGKENVAVDSKAHKELPM